MNDLKIEVRVSNKIGNRAKVSLRIEMENGGISVSDICVREISGKLSITFPLANNQRPYVYFRGELKQRINAAISQAFYQGTGQAAPTGV